ncbi:sulfotransferase family protein [Aquisphaera insulae]|uniref:sulfotransferase family protein n=1 Tax=Aquisphaera insulae TaxID=2712864 RepID=UPI0013EA6376|nr:sulfotransferase [Aquisphaera insulae]
MLYFPRLLLAMFVVHLLEGITWGDWIRLLRREGFRISPICWPRVVWITTHSLANSAMARHVARTRDAEIEAARVEAPVFILGHYRSGTTFLHELMATDPRFASPTRFQTFNPRTFLFSERWLAPLVEPFMLPRRVQEDEVALMNLVQQSPYMDWCFPRSRVGYRRFSTLRGADPAEIAAWSDAFGYFLRSLTVRYRRPLILKSPPHTGRIRYLLEAFPDARFVHIRRDPYTVYRSMRSLLRDIRPVFRLQTSAGEDDEEFVLSTYRDMYDAYFEDRALIPAGRQMEIAYEDLEADPIGQLRAVYRGLSLADFEPIRPAVDAYLQSIRGYRKSRHEPLDDELRRRIAGAWSRCFDEWGYPR